MEQVLSGEAMLIVEDEAFIRHDLLDFFEDHGFRVLEAESADVAVKVLAANPAIRVVITDVQMPGSMDGIKLAHFIRERYPPTLLIVASGAIIPQGEDLPERTLFVSKPFDSRVLLREIERRLGGK